MLGNLGLGEILIILVLILVLFGPKKIPELAGTVGRYINQFRRQMEEAQRAVIDPLRADLTDGSPPQGEYPLGGYPATDQNRGNAGPLYGQVGGGPYVPPPPPIPLTEDEERARQPKRLLD